MSLFRVLLHRLLCVFCVLMLWGCPFFGDDEGNSESSSTWSSGERTEPWPGPRPTSDPDSSSVPDGWDNGTVPETTEIPGEGPSSSPIPPIPHGPVNNTVPPIGGGGMGGGFFGAGGSPGFGGSGLGGRGPALPPPPPGPPPLHSHESLVAEFKQDGVVVRIVESNGSYSLNVFGVHYNKDKNALFFFSKDGKKLERFEGDVYYQITRNKINKGSFLIIEEKFFKKEESLYKFRLNSSSKGKPNLLWGYEFEEVAKFKLIVPENLEGKKSEGVNYSLYKCIGEVGSVGYLEFDDIKIYDDYSGEKYDGSFNYKVKKVNGDKYKKYKGFEFYEIDFSGAFFKSEENYIFVPDENGDFDEKVLAIAKLESAGNKTSFFERVKIDGKSGVMLKDGLGEHASNYLSKEFAMTRSQINYNMRIIMKIMYSMEIFSQSTRNMDELLLFDKEDYWKVSISFLDFIKNETEEDRGSNLKVVNLMLRSLGSINYEFTREDKEKIKALAKELSNNIGQDFHEEFEALVDGSTPEKMRSILSEWGIEVYDI